MTMQDPIDYCKKNCHSSYQYKELATGGNNPHITARMRYANLVNHTKNLNRVSVVTTKDKKTGDDTQTTCSTVKNTYTPTGILIGKTICVKNGNTM
jgi:hypothetical protein